MRLSLLPGYRVMILLGLLPPPLYDSDSCENRRTVDIETLGRTPADLSDLLVPESCTVYYLLRPFVEAYRQPLSTPRWLLRCLLGSKVWDFVLAIAF